MAKLTNIPRFSSDMFTWHNGEGVSEFSNFKAFDRISGRVYDDACDLGFEVVSKRTGDVKLFFMVEAKHDDDVQCFVYQSEDGIKITIFND